MVNNVSIDNKDSFSIYVPVYEIYKEKRQSRSQKTHSLEGKVYTHTYTHNIQYNEWSNRTLQEHIE